MPIDGTSDVLIDRLMLLAMCRQTIVQVGIWLLQTVMAHTAQNETDLVVDYKSMGICAYGATIPERLKTAS